jgi:hypothetical protein
MTGFLRTKVTEEGESYHKQLDLPTENPLIFGSRQKKIILQAHHACNITFMRCPAKYAFRAISLEHMEGFITAHDEMLFVKREDNAICLLKSQSQRKKSQKK